MDPNTKRTWAEISLDNLAHNMKTIRASLPAETKFLGVVKADAYGHGAVPAAKALESHGADYLAVACVDEALELRGAGVKLPILILGHTPADCVPELIQNNITQALGAPELTEAYEAAAAACGGILRVHIKADTGMSRTGFSCACTDARFEAGVAEIAAACRMPHLDAEGIFTHFAVSDEPDKPASVAYTRAQFRLFRNVTAALEKQGISFKLRHCANTGAVLNYSETTALDMARPGILLYGYGDEKGKFDVKPCMRLMTRVAMVKTYPAGTAVSYGGTFVTERETRVGVLPVGYADGLRRALSNRCAFWTGAGPAKQIGRVCMDMCMLDLTDLPGIGAGDPVEVFGERSRLEAMAEAAGTITYELLCGVSKRVPRIYV